MVWVEWAECTKHRTKPVDRYRQKAVNKRGELKCHACFYISIFIIRITVMLINPEDWEYKSTLYKNAIGIIFRIIHHLPISRDFHRYISSVQDNPYHHELYGHNIQFAKSDSRFAC